MERKNQLVKIRMLKADSQCQGPFVRIQVRSGPRKSNWFLARIDTGADITMIPTEVLDNISADLYNDPIEIDFANGEREDIKPVSCDVQIEGIKQTFNPPKGVVPIPRNTGLLGMDILEDCILYLYNKGGLICRNEE